MNGTPGLVVVQSILDSLRCALSLLRSMKLDRLDVCIPASTFYRASLHVSLNACCISISPVEWRSHGVEGEG